MLIIVADQALPTDQVSDRFKAPYGYQTITADQLARWNSDQVNPDITLPPANPFIPERLSHCPISQSIH